MGILREQMQQSQPYWKFNREERNYTALLYHALLSGRNLSHFLQKLRTRNITPSHLGPTEVQDVSNVCRVRTAPETFGPAEGAHKQKDAVNTARRQAVLDLLQPANRGQLGVKH